MARGRESIPHLGPLDRLEALGLDERAKLVTGISWANEDKSKGWSIEDGSGLQLTYSDGNYVLIDRRPSTIAEFGRPGRFFLKAGEEITPAKQAELEGYLTALEVGEDGQT